MFSSYNLGLRVIFFFYLLLTLISLADTHDCQVVSLSSLTFTDFVSFNNESSVVGGIPHFPVEENSREIT